MDEDTLLTSGDDANARTYCIPCGVVIDLGDEPHVCACEYTRVADSTVDWGSSVGDVTVTGLVLGLDEDLKLDLGGREGVGSFTLRVLPLGEEFNVSFKELVSYLRGRAGQ